MAPVNLYEDAQGNLYLHQEGAPEAWCVRPGQGSFLQDAADVANGRTTDWQRTVVEWGAVEPKEDESRLVHVASWSGPNSWRVIGDSDSTARGYLDVSRAVEPPPPEPPHTVHQAREAALGSPDASGLADAVTRRCSGETSLAQPGASVPILPPPRPLRGEGAGVRTPGSGDGR